MNPSIIMVHTVAEWIELARLVKDDLEVIRGAADTICGPAASGAQREPDLPGIEDSHLNDIQDFLLLNGARLGIPADVGLGLLRNLKRYEMCRNRYRMSRARMRDICREMRADMEGSTSRLESEKAYNHTIVAECLTLLGLLAPEIRRILPAIDEDIKSLDPRYRVLSKKDYHDCIVKRTCAGPDNGTCTDNGTCAETCCFCLESLEEGSVVHELIACRHQFHPLCLSQFLTSNRVIPQCPLCRTEISPEKARKDQAIRRKVLVEMAAERLRSKGWSDEGTLERAANTVVAQLLHEGRISVEQTTQDDPFAEAGFDPEPLPADVGAKNDAAVIAFQAADAAERAVQRAVAAVRMAKRGPIRRFRLRRPVPPNDDNDDDDNDDDDDPLDSDTDEFYDWGECEDPVVTSCQVAISTAWPSAP